MGEKKPREGALSFDRSVTQALKGGEGGREAAVGVAVGVALVQCDHGMSMAFGSSVGTGVQYLH